MTEIDQNSTQGFVYTAKVALVRFLYPQNAKYLFYTIRTSTVCLFPDRYLQANVFYTVPPQRLKGIY